MSPLNRIGRVASIGICHRCVLKKFFGHNLSEYSDDLTSSHYHILAQNHWQQAEALSSSDLLYFLYYSSQQRYPLYSIRYEVMKSARRSDGVNEIAYPLVFTFTFVEGRHELQVRYSIMHWITLRRIRIPADMTHIPNFLVTYRPRIERSRWTRQKSLHDGKHYLHIIFEMCIRQLS